MAYFHVESKNDYYLFIYFTHLLYVSAFYIPLHGLFVLSVIFTRTFSLHFVITLL